MSDPAEQMHAAAQSFLRSRGSTLWGQAYDITDPDRLNMAATWFLLEMMAFSSGLQVQSSVDAKNDDQLELEFT